MVGIIAAGVFALITTTGVMTRFAEKTHTAKYVRQYENAVAFGAILFNYILGVWTKLWGNETMKSIISINRFVSLGYS